MTTMTMTMTMMSQRRICTSSSIKKTFPGLHLITRNSSWLASGGKNAKAIGRPTATITKTPIVAAAATTTVLLKNNMVPLDVCTYSVTKRYHMNHGSGGGHHHHHPMGTGGGGGGGRGSGGDIMKDGPREAYVPLGFEATKHTGNLLRLLESSQYQYGSHLSSTVWHLKGGQYWIYDYDSSQWTAYSPDQPLSSSSSNTYIMMPNTLASILFADECTALIKLVDRKNKGNTRYISLLKLMDDDSMAQRERMGGPPFLANDGWMIVREVVANNNNNNININDDNIGDKRGYQQQQQQEQQTTVSMKHLLELSETIKTYWSIEHGGGLNDRKRAEQLFHPNASLVSVGMTKEEDISHPNTNEWVAPVGSLLNISLDTYLKGVESQTPHSQKSSRHDAIINLDISGNAAAVTLTVGNGAQTMVFQDHLLLGRDEKEDSWKILSKTFSPQAWPKEL